MSFSLGINQPPPPLKYAFHNIPSFIHSFIHLFIYSFIHSFILYFAIYTKFYNARWK